MQFLYLANKSKYYVLDFVNQFYLFLVEIDDNWMIYIILMSGSINCKMVWQLKQRCGQTCSNNICKLFHFLKYSKYKVMYSKSTFITNLATKHFINKNSTCIPSIIIKCFSSHLTRIIMRAVSKEASNKDTMHQNSLNAFIKLQKALAFSWIKNERQKTYKTYFHH